MARTPGWRASEDIMADTAGAMCVDSADIGPPAVLFTECEMIRGVGHKLRHVLGDGWIGF